MEPTIKIRIFCCLLLFANYKQKSNIHIYGPSQKNAIQTSRFAQKMFFKIECQVISVVREKPSY